MKRDHVSVMMRLCQCHDENRSVSWPDRVSVMARSYHCYHQIVLELSCVRGTIRLQLKHLWCHQLVAMFQYNVELLVLKILVLFASSS